MIYPELPHTRPSSHLGNGYPVKSLNPSQFSPTFANSGSSNMRSSKSKSGKAKSATGRSNYGDGIKSNAGSAGGSDAETLSKNSGSGSQNIS